MNCFTILKLWSLYALLDGHCSAILTKSPFNSLLMDYIVCCLVAPANISWIMMYLLLQKAKSIGFFPPVPTELDAVGSISDGLFASCLWLLLKLYGS